MLVRPGEVLWIDVLLPRGDALWDDDVGRAAHWLGETWRDALGVGVVHTGQMIRTPLVERDLLRGRRPGRGAARRREGRRHLAAAHAWRARFQCAVLRTWDSTELARIFAAGEWREVADSLDRVAVGVADLAGLEAAFLAALTSR